MIVSDLSQAKYGDIILFEPIRFLSRIQVKIDNIRQNKKFNFSHGALYWGKEGGNHLMIESVNECGVHISKINYWKNYIIVRPIDKKIITKVKLSDYIGKKYDFSKIYAVIANRLFGVSLTVDGDEQVICTELINLAYNYKLTAKGMCTPITLANAIL